ncbi:UDP-N-acetylmuramoyl-tripeptide--D-alanyl-D-alanine ligase [Parachitinimonas caeni]|uniref:UDP-N-acetylmuramoyl-tripeptide--D-alanyl-D-alanine ligase n=1 Tax=Parachitinimonas caeni TaxID=3031301 RepID=A0ABT7DR73_9NEIS|nr:UDP-N-acetylmuramoyl-tripeptide--D-alanyl-D-alanine ligase [Parachitinimonas caeni]MDK2122459.1 UDP-N-acetylmuramoyl-tripeptide--D-alanyl-D-alanine ligase [Parachitinimonas caeni]
MSGMWTVAEAARHLGASCPRPAEAVFARVSTDSRDLQPADLFVALRGERFDGHEFVAQAAQAGAAAAVVDQAFDLNRVPADFPLIIVEDTVAALGLLGTAWRSQFDLPLLAITGSSGKTSVKEMLAAVLRYHAGPDAVLATAGNLNNHLGVPQMLLRLRPQHRYAVIEMGMNHAGEIRYLTKLAKPTAALVNNAGAAHLEFLGSVEGVARAKGEIFEGLTPAGIACFNADDAFAGFWHEQTRPQPQMTFGIERGQIRASQIALLPLGSRFVLHSPQGDVAVELALPGRHNIANALAAATLALSVNIDLPTIAAGLATCTGAKGRLQRKQALSGALVIDDSYNANPDSMRAAVAVLAQFAAPRLFVMGDMGEIGADISARHAEIGEAARAAGIEHLLALGEQTVHAVARFGEGARHYSDLNTLLADLKSLSGAQSTVLVKGSRFMRMERVVDALTTGKLED